MTDFPSTSAKYQENTRKSPELLSAQSQVISCLNRILELKSQENAHRPLPYKRKFYLVLKSINSQKRIQEQLKAAYNYLQQLLNICLSDNKDHPNQIIILDGSVSSKNDEGLIFIQQHGKVIEAGIIGKPEENVIMYNDEKGIYQIRKVLCNSHKDRMTRIEGYLYEERIMVGRSSKLYEIDAIPGLIRDIQSSDFRRKGLKIYRISSLSSIDLHNVAKLIGLMQRIEVAIPVGIDQETQLTKF